MFVPKIIVMLLLLSACSYNKKKCEELPVCKWFSYQWEYKYCHLFKDCHYKWGKVNDWFPYTGSKGWLSSPIKCPEFGIGCSVDGIRIPFEEENLDLAVMPVVKNVEDVFECQRNCRIFPH